MDTEKTEAEAVDMQAMMTAAAEDEVTTPEVVVEPEVEGVVEEPAKVEAPKEQELPADNAERSKLGRKMEAMWKRQDEQTATLEKVAQAFELMVEKQTTKPEEEDTLITASQAADIAEKRFAELKAAEQKSVKDYEKQYFDQLAELSTDFEPGEFDEINKIMMADFNVRHSDHGKFDAVRNFKDAQIKYLQSGQKVLKKGKLPDGAKLATTGTEKVKSKKNPLPKLDEAANRFLSWVERRDGPEAAKRLRESA